ncbi:MAG: FecR domain-containing protein [Verrucomicrobiota bacterium]
MKFLKVATLAAVTALFLSNAAQAQEKVGIIKAFLVKGNVSLVNNATGATEPLSRGREFNQGYTVVTGSDSTALLLFSNGASINVSPDSKLNVTEFEQAAYDPELGSFLRLKADPSVSKTVTNLEYGEVIGEVRKLSAGSSYTVNTPVASAGIRGTVWVVSFNPTTGRFETTNVTGDVFVTLSSGQVIPVPAEQTYVLVNFNGALESANPAALARARQFLRIVEFFNRNVPSIPPIIVDPNTAVITQDTGEVPSENIPVPSVGNGPTPTTTPTSTDDVE